MWILVRSSFTKICRAWYRQNFLYTRACLSFSREVFLWTLQTDKDQGFQGRMLSMWNILHEHRHSAIFLHPVTDRDAPGYSRAVFWWAYAKIDFTVEVSLATCFTYSPVDLTTVKREADSGVISAVNAFTLKLVAAFSIVFLRSSTCLTMVFKNILDVCKCGHV